MARGGGYWQSSGYSLGAQKTAQRLVLPRTPYLARVAPSSMRCKEIPPGAHPNHSLTACFLPPWPMNGAHGGRRETVADECVQNAWR